MPDAWALTTFLTALIVAGLFWLARSPEPRS